MDSRLAVLLATLAKLEQKVEISREIMGQNMNFSPAWLLSILQRPGSTSSNFITIKQFAAFIQFIKASFTASQIALIFDYFDAEKQGKINHKAFVEGLIPHQKTALRKAILKRLAEDLQMTTQLKYAMKRFFQQVLVCQKNMVVFEGQFDNSKIKDIEKYETLTQKQLRQYMNFYGKCLTEGELSLILHSISLGRVKAVRTKLINQLIKKKLSSPNNKQTEKHNPSLKSINNENIFQKSREITQPLTLKGKKQQGQGRERKELEQTPIERIKNLNQEVHFPKRQLMKKPSNISDISLMQSMNEANEDAHDSNCLKGELESFGSK